MVRPPMTPQPSIPRTASGDGTKAVVSPSAFCFLPDSLACSPSSDATAAVEVATVSIRRKQQFLRTGAMPGEHPCPRPASLAPDFSPRLNHSFRNPHRPARATIPANRRYSRRTPMPTPGLPRPRLLTPPQPFTPKQSPPRPSNNSCEQTLCPANPHAHVRPPSPPTSHFASTIHA